MNLYNIKHPEEQVNFAQAVRQGLGKDQGLFFPEIIPHLDNIDALLELPLVERSEKILGALIGDEIPADKLAQMVKNAFTFPAPVEKVADHIYALELFHGPTLAFKDFGGRFMAQALATVRGDGKITILTATSGDTGAAVAHAFYGLENIDVVILYPKGKISPLQEKLFCTLGGNIRTVAINGDFDDCQALVKQAFDDAELRQAIGLNSANSINISRLLAQVCYYFEAVAQLPKAERENIVVSVPSGNFGNLTAGLIAKTMGLPIKRFIAATNANDTVPRYLSSGEWSPNDTVATLSNAMDVSRPNNWPRVEELFKRNGWALSELHSAAMSDEQTEHTLQAMNEQDYLCEPHGAIAYGVLKQDLQAGETGLFLCTAHPAKFKESVERILSTELPLPEALDKHNKLPLLSDEMDNDFATLKAYLLKK
ncbi:threonine synthase [Avibacterium paragallinarum]|uniref:Threonine synthase n=1 Tax=Avibacterium paragallinarum TaxID=728 RepID=A0AAE5WIF3_AVIPA|nr:threonine synthase [Avibacterium paragallinarum]MEE3608618.1 threonine synthase [Avibacterium paragallinarum]MEE3620698.1 threonine synthase [Avibacterium paragallinarum]MEE3668667.1 threonine synthase [Avibacterium paragallinarum]MEE3680311.1 threonine synthase [Avibacterium paragallinarum]MEE4385410.1 threonine synthase [Avibacterium paragallinarum]